MTNRKTKKREEKNLIPPILDRRIEKKESLKKQIFKMTRSLQNHKMKLL
jgi:hypothetical protein